MDAAWMRLYSYSRTVWMRVYSADPPLYIERVLKEWNKEPTGGRTAESTNSTSKPFLDIDPFRAA